jgi:hypothetical protein
MTQSVTQENSLLSVLHDVLGVYDQRFLELDADQRHRLVQATRHILGDAALPTEARSVLPAAYRLRAFCIQRELHDELERLILDEAEGRVPGAVVVGGRVYAMYPYLRGVARHDADITDEVHVEHILTGLSWTGGRLRVRGRAALSHIETRQSSVDLILRTPGDFARTFPTTPYESGFEAIVDPAGLSPGSWTFHVSVTALGITREAVLGGVRDPKLKPEPRRRDGHILHFAHLATLTLKTPETPIKPKPLQSLFRRRRNTP